jgi:cytochrome c oxidase cbb3-type subunit 3
LPKLSSGLAVLFSIVGMATLLASQGLPSRNASRRDPGSAEQGKQAFAANCSVCHGLDGSGGERAPSIASGSDAAKLSPADLKRIVTNGIAGAGMPPFASLGQPEIQSVVSYLRTLQGKGNTIQLPGNSERGSTLFFGKAGCSSCHMAAGKGGFLAADLTAYGQGRSPDEIRDAITTPGKDLDQRIRQAAVVFRDGKKYSGVVRTEDNFSIALQTLDGQFVLAPKSDLANIAYNSTPVMPTDYATTLSSAELNDVISFLMNLKQNNDPSAARKTGKRNWEDED